MCRSRSAWHNRHAVREAEMSGARFPWHWAVAQFGWAAARWTARGLASPWHVVQFRSAPWWAVWQRPHIPLSGARVSAFEWQMVHAIAGVWRA